MTKWVAIILSIASGFPPAFAGELDFAHGLYEQRRYKLAADEYRAYLDKTPDGALADDARFYLAESIRQTGNLKDSLALFQQLLQKGGPENRHFRQSLFRVAQTLYFQGQFASAIEPLERFIRQFPEDDAAAIAGSHLAEAALSIGDLEKSERAVAFAEKRIAADRANKSANGELGDQVRLTKGKVFLKRGLHEEALKIFQPLAQSKGKASTIAQARYYSAIALAKAGKSEPAKQELATLLREDPNGPFFVAARAELMRLALETKDELLLDRMIGDATDLTASAKPRILSATLRFDRQEYGQAANILKPIAGLKLDPVLAADRDFLLGMSLEKVGQAKIAIETLLSFLSSGPNAALATSAARSLGRAIAASNAPEVSLAELEKYDRILANTSKPNLTRLALADGLYEAKKYRESADRYGIVTKSSDPNDRLRGHLGLGWSHWEQKEFPSAGRHFDQAADLATDPSLPAELLAEAVYMSGVAANRQGDRESAARRFRTLLDRFGMSIHAADAALALAGILIRKDPEAAIAALAPTMQRERDKQKLANIRLLAGQARFHQKRWTEAANEFDQCRKLSSDPSLMASAAFWLGETAMAAGDPDKAIGWFRAVGKSESLQARTELRIAECLLQKKDWRAAFDQAEKVANTRSDPTITNEALMIQGASLERQTRFDEARQKYSAIAESGRTALAAKARFFMGETFFHQGKTAEAIKEFLKVEILYDDPDWRAAALLEVGKLHESMGETRAASETFDRLLERYPKSPITNEAKKRRATLGK